MVRMEEMLQSTRILEQALDRRVKRGVRGQVRVEGRERGVEARKAQQVFDLMAEFAGLVSKFRKALGVLEKAAALGDPKVAETARSKAALLKKRKAG